MYNEEDAIDYCLESIYQQDYPIDRIEVLVIDGGSTDQSCTKVNQWIKHHPNLFLYHNPNRRTPLSLNIGIEKSKGEVVVFIGAHTKIDHRFVSLNIHYMYDQNVKCTGGTQINIGETFMQNAIGHAMQSIFGIPSATYRYSKTKGYVESAGYCSYNRVLFEQVGKYNEKNHIAEDAEMNWRIRAAGNKIYYSPEIIVYYYPRKSIYHLSKQFINYGIARVNVFKRYPKAVNPIRLIPPLFVLLTIMGLALMPLSGTSNHLLEYLWIIYGLYLAIGSVITSIQIKTFRYSLVLPILFMSMQLSWGTGFLVGLFKTYKRNPV